MHRVVLLCVGLFVGDVREYSRPLSAGKLDQTTLDAEGFGVKKAFKRENDGLRVTLAPGAAETGWKTPQGVRIGGDFTVTARFVIRKLPKPAQEDGAAVGLSIATQNIDQPDATLIRLIETDGSDVYRPIDASKNNAPQVMQPARGRMMMQPGMGPGAGGKPPKPERKTFPAKGEAVRLELRREGSTVRYHVLDAASDSLRYLGQLELGTADIAGLKLFASNRNGAEAVDVLFRDLTIHAERITGLGTEVRTVFGAVIHGEPTAIENGTLIIGGPAKAAPPAASGPSKAENAAPGAEIELPADVFALPPAAPAVVAAPVVAAVPAAAPAPAPAANQPTTDSTSASPKKAAPPPKPPPKVRVPLDEVESIAFERSLILAGRFVGQPNLDFTMPGAAKGQDGPAKPVAKADDVLAPPPGTVAAVKIPKLDPKPNAIRDLHLTLSNLSNAEIKQVTINGQTSEGPSAWRLDTSGSHDWPLVLRRAGTESWADLFLEPPPGDLKGKDLTVNVTYSDGQNGNVTIKVDQRTDPKLAFDPKEPAPSIDARVYLTGDEQLFGKLDGLGEESLRLRTPWGDRLNVPLARVAGVYMGLPDHKESVESFARRLRARGTEDLLLARSKDGEVVAIAGIAEGTEGDKLRFHFQEKTRTLPLKQVEGLVLAARPEPERPDGLRPTFAMTGGLVVSGLWKKLDEKSWKIETAWGETLDLPATDVRGVRFRGGQMTYLSDLEPSRVEETPFFGRRSPWRKDVNLAGGPLKMDSRTYERGLAVHSRTALTYDLDRRYTTFEALVGFDDSAKRMGRVDCRVFADAKEIYANPDLQANAPPVRLALPVSGVERLRLVVDFGHDQDTGDRVIWANARLFRRPPPVPETSSEAARPPQNESEQARPKTSKTGSGE